MKKQYTFKVCEDIKKAFQLRTMLANETMNEQIENLMLCFIMDLPLSDCTTNVKDDFYTNAEGVIKDLQKQTMMLLKK